MRTLQEPSSGVEVVFLQRLLNKARARHRGRIPGLSEDGQFGPNTGAAVRAFQALPRTRQLVDDGIVGPRTWRALGQTVDIDHRLTLQPQHTSRTCWQAAATMVGAARGPGWSVMTSPQHQQYYLTSGMNGHSGTVQLARELGWSMLDHSPSLMELVAIMRRTPVYVAGNLIATGGAHAVAFGAIYSDGTPDGTVIKVYNPWPVGVGNIHHFHYMSMVTPGSGSPFIPRDFVIPP